MNRAAAFSLARRSGGPEAGSSQGVEFEQAP